MNILYVGDVMGEMGLQVVADMLPKLRRQHKVDLVIAQAENVTEGKGTSLADFKKLRDIGIDFCTGGNWSMFRDDIFPTLSDPAQPIIRPANLPAGTPGLGWKYVEAAAGKVLVISLLGNVIGRDADKEIDNPLKIVNQILSQEQKTKKIATVVNLHGDYSSQKVAIGHYLDKRVSLVVGDHWHVPTADAQVLPGGTAHITDVGMCGSLDSSLGVSFDSVLPRWLDGIRTKNLLEESGRKQFNAVLVSVNGQGLASSIVQMRQVLK